MLNLNELKQFLRLDNQAASKPHQRYLYFLLCILIITLRYPSFIFEPRIWAEESIYYETFFSAQNWWDGFDAVLYPEYYVLISRVAGLCASMVDPSNAALVTSLFGLTTLTLPLTIIFFGNSEYWKSTAQKLTLAAFLIFSCSTGEIWMNSTNVGFIMAVVTFLILIDEHSASICKRIFYGFCLSLSILTGPISLIMSPFFLYRYIHKREPSYFTYCVILLFLGLIQLSYFLISFQLEIGATVNRGILLPDSISTFFSYWLAPNIIFPIFGYFASVAVRTILILANTNPELLFSYIESAPLFLSIIFRLLLNTVKYSIVFLIPGFILLFYFECRNSSHHVKVYLIVLFLYLSLILTTLSLGGQGGHRYSYVCAFIFLFYFLQKLNYLENGREKTITKLIVLGSIFIGIVEYYPRVVSFTPDWRSTDSQPWSNWKQEVAKFRENPDYTPEIWPGFRSNGDFWPARNKVWQLNLSEHETWNNAGKFRYSEEVKKYFR